MEIQRSLLLEFTGYCENGCDRVQSLQATTGIMIQESPVFIGRTPRTASDIVLDVPGVSDYQARLLYDYRRHRWYIEDCDSLRGTWLWQGDEKIQVEAGRPVPLFGGQEILLGTIITRVTISPVTVGRFVVTMQNLPAPTEAKPAFFPEDIDEFFGENADFLDMASESHRAQPETNPQSIFESEPLFPHPDEKTKSTTEPATPQHTDAKPPANFARNHRYSDAKGNKRRTGRLRGNIEISPKRGAKTSTLRFPRRTD